MKVQDLLRKLRTPRIRSERATRRPRPAILMYHRVAELKNDPWLLAVSPENFNQQISYISTQRTPMFVDEMVHRLGNGTLPANAIAVTFDDGYRDNLVNAKPVLARYGVPGTVFLTTGSVGQEQPYWWDELATVVLEQKEPVSSTVTVGIEKVPIAWREMERDDLSPCWQAWDKPRTARQKSYVALWCRLRLLSENERAPIMVSLRKQFTPDLDQMSLPMNVQDIKDLLDGGTMTLGAHTVTHPVLTQVPRKQCTAEIFESARHCSAYLGKAVSGFAYPYGEVDQGVRDDASLSELRWACSTETKFLDQGPLDLFRLPRIGVYDAPLPVFMGCVTSGD